MSKIQAMKKYLVYAFIFFAGVAAGMCLHLIFPDIFRHRDDLVAVRTDTVTVRKTIKVDRPVPVHSFVRGRIWLFLRDTVATGDTVLVRDTVYLERETKVYQDSLYRAVVSGFRPSLDSLTIFHPVRYITRTETVKVLQRKPWGIGIQAGYGATIQNGRIAGVPYIGVGVSYNLLSF